MRVLPPLATSVAGQGPRANRPCRPSIDVGTDHHGINLASVQGHSQRNAGWLWPVMAHFVHQRLGHMPQRRTSPCALRRAGLSQSAASASSAGGLPIDDSGMCLCKTRLTTRKRKPKRWREEQKQVPPQRLNCPDVALLATQRRMASSSIRHPNEAGDREGAVQRRRHGSRT